ncbi:biotin synthase BioB [Paraliomyxa miuraensis]|uniref:biotin synthase BioB n=1 Tax=Paraliomyxa miuraensis TaxID=376150 RepID=UPI00225A3C7A|nr:biotin synthase BioB [Paraliomyxa miuraensis]MCX4239781.1 biotin synthase BioB [Paraliomyxa miuraensis]
MSRPDPAVFADRILAGDDHAVDAPTLLAFLSEDVDVWDLMAAADRVRRARFADRVHLCSIVNAKEGGCPEDCGFCSQSRHFSTHVTASKFTPIDEVVAHSIKARDHHATALGLVTATRGLPDDSKGLAHVEAAIRAVREAGHTEAHASVGFLSEAALDRLVDAGLTELNHNLETGRSYFAKIVSTHTYDERIATIRRAKAKGLRTCVGGIFGMGEAPSDRVELAQALRELDVDEVPLNFLVSIDGTALQKVEPLQPLQILRIIAAYRLFLPRQNIFIAAGRTHLGQLLPLMFTAGASGMMIGDFLTTPNRGPQDDLRMLDELGLRPYGCGTDHEARPELTRATPTPTPGEPHSAPVRARLPVVA